MITDNAKVAELRPIPPQLATQRENNATLNATTTQPKKKTSLKALADRVSLRNQDRNQHATPNNSEAQLLVEKTALSCAPFSLGNQEVMEQKTAPLAPLKKIKFKPSPIALAWLLEHREALDAAGWSRAELYRRNKSKRGLAWLLLWEQAFFLAYLHEDGEIEFECSVHGRDYIQTARPQPKSIKR